MLVKENINRLWGGRGEGQPNQPRQFSPPIQPTDFPTRQIRLEFDQTTLPYYTEIDAVCLLGTLHPITPSAKVAAMLPSKPLPPILGRVVSSGLHVLPASTDEILEACTDQLSRPAVNLYIRQFSLGSLYIVQFASQLCFYALLTHNNTPLSKLENICREKF